MLDGARAEPGPSQMVAFGLGYIGTIRTILFIQEEEYSKERLRIVLEGGDWKDGRFNVISEKGLWFRGRINLGELGLGSVEGGKGCPNLLQKRASTNVMQTFQLILSGTRRLLCLSSQTIITGFYNAENEVTGPGSSF